MTKPGPWSGPHDGTQNSVAASCEFEAVADGMLALPAAAERRSVSERKSRICVRRFSIVEDLQVSCFRSFLKRPAIGDGEDDIDLLAPAS